MNSPLTIAAVVATHNRPHLLATRSLPSIASQTRSPNLLVVVDDSDNDIRKVNEEVVATFKSKETYVVYLENRRARGNSGAWNTAMAYLHNVASNSFVAILDDDDSWERDYLELCGEAVGSGNLDMVACGILRHESSCSEAILLDPPEHLDPNQFLTGNPHIQGSNLFIRLRTLMEAGGFDEALPSATDRDLCIRIADLGYARFHPLRKHLVHHHAEPGRLRLSSPGSDKKCRGLREFYRKYRSRMSNTQRHAFLERASRLFGCDPCADYSTKLVYRNVNSGSPANSEKLDILVGTIASGNIKVVAGLLEDLHTAFSNRNDVEIQVAILDNRPAHERSQSIPFPQGLDITVLDVETHPEKSRFKSGLSSATDIASIASARTMLQRRLYDMAKNKPGTVIWILDDDCRMDALTLQGPGKLVRRRPDYSGQLRRLRDSGYDVVIGEVTGEPPLPFSSSIRVQLLDLYHNLTAMSHMIPQAPYPRMDSENALFRARHPDYYYDLSARDTGHLETPFWYQPSLDGATYAQAFTEMVLRTPQILRGVQVFRPLASAPIEVRPMSLSPSADRGPNTLVFDTEALRDFPNAVPSIGGRDTRRGDMIWSLLNIYAGGRSVVSAPFPVRQDRTLVEPGEPDFDKLVQDIHGHSVRSVLEDILSRKAKAGSGLELLSFTQSDLDWAVVAFRDYVSNRLTLFELSCLRIIGLLKALGRFTEIPCEGGSEPPWWLLSKEYAESTHQLRQFITDMKNIYTERRIVDFHSMLMDYNPSDIRRYFENLEESVREYRAEFSDC